MLQKQDGLEILELLRKEPGHVRQIAAKLNMVPTTVMRILKKLQDQGVVDFHKEGRNTKYYIRDTLEAQAYLRIVEEYKFVRLSHNPLLRRIFKDLREMTKGELIVVFGSHAKNSAFSKSDIDLYVETKESRLKQRMQNLSHKLSIKTGSFDKDSPLGKEIIKDHVIVQNVERFYALLK